MEPRLRCILRVPGEPDTAPHPFSQPIRLRVRLAWRIVPPPLQPPSDIAPALADRDDPTTVPIRR